MAHSTRQAVLFPDLLSKPAHVQFDLSHSSSDGGLLLIKALDERLGLTQRLADCIDDPRQAAKVQHSIRDMILQRVMALACGYPDANDAGQLRHDPMHKLVTDRDPIGGDALASQPTLSRFENTPSVKGLHRMGHVLLDQAIDQYPRQRRRKVKRICVDLDPTHDETHGTQQLAMFNGFYDCWCYQTMLGFLTFDDGEHHLFTAVLEPGNADPRSKTTLGILRRTLPRLRLAFPKAQIQVRLDSGFACPKLFDFLDEEQVEYVVGFTKNEVLERRSRRLLGTARRKSRQTEKTATFYGETRYAAKTWPYRRRVVYKAEVVRLGDRKPKDNCRYVVTNLPHVPKSVYGIFCERGDRENRIKELKQGMQIDRTSCTSFWANQFRVFLTAAAYILLQQLRQRLKKTLLATAQVQTLRLKLLKIAARIERSVRRFVVHLAADHPWSMQWQLAARSLGGCSP